MPPVKNRYYDFLRRHYPHQVKGSKLITSSQPANTSSPVFIYSTHYTPVTCFLQQLQNLSVESLSIIFKFCFKNTKKS